HRACIESGAALQVTARDLAIRNGEALLAKLGIPKAQVHDVQKVPLDKLMAAYFAVTRDNAGVDQSIGGFAPTVDGKLLPQHPFQPAASPVSADVPVMIGSTRTEMTLFSNNGDPAAFNLDDAGLQMRVNALLGDQSRGVIDLYRKLNAGASASDI